MVSSSLCRMAALSLLLGLTAYAAPAQQDSTQQSGTDPVAEAARKARAEQKAAPKPKKVFTNDDMPNSAPVSTVGAASSSGTAQDSTDTTGAAAGNSKEDPNGEAVWRKKFKNLRDKITNAEKDLDVLQRELNKDQVQYYPDPQKALMQQHDRSDINEKTAKIDAKTKEIEALKQQESDLEDQLRKAGGDPGWAR